MFMAQKLLANQGVSLYELYSKKKESMILLRLQLQDTASINDENFEGTHFSP